MLALALLLAPAEPEPFAERWLVLGVAHERTAAAERQAKDIRARNHPIAGVVATDHYEGLPPGLHVIVFAVAASRPDAYARVTAVRNLGHRSWTRFSGAFVAQPTAEGLRRRRLALALPAGEAASEVVAVGRLVAGLVDDGRRAALAVARPRRLGSDLAARAPLPRGCRGLRLLDGDGAARPATLELRCGDAARRFRLAGEALRPL